MQLYIFFFPRCLSGSIAAMVTILTGMWHLLISSMPLASPVNLQWSTFRISYTQVCHCSVTSTVISGMLLNSYLWRWFHCFLVAQAQNRRIKFLIRIFFSLQGLELWGKSCKKLMEVIQTRLLLRSKLKDHRLQYTSQKKIQRLFDHKELEYQTQDIR